MKYILIKCLIFASLVCLGSYGINKSIQYGKYLHSEYHRELTTNEEYALKNIEYDGWYCGKKDSGISFNPYSQIFFPKEYSIWRNGYLRGENEQ